MFFAVYFCGSYLAHIVTFLLSFQPPLPLLLAMLGNVEEQKPAMETSLARSRQGTPGGPLVSSSDKIVNIFELGLWAASPPPPQFSRLGVGWSYVGLVITVLEILVASP